MATIVVVFQPAMPGEKLSLASQVQQVFGPFDDDAEAEHWIETFQKRLNQIKWEFLVCPLDSPNDIPTDPSLN